MNLMKHFIIAALAGWAMITVASSAAQQTKGKAVEAARTSQTDLEQRIRSVLDQELKAKLDPEAEKLRNELQRMVIAAGVEAARVAAVAQTNIEQRVTSVVDQELKAKAEVEKLQDEMHEVLAAGKETQAVAHEQVLTIVHLMEWFMGGLTVLSIILILMGVREVSQLKKLRKNAQKDTKAAIKRAQDASDHIVKIGEGVKNAWGDIDEAFKKLPKFEDYIVGSAPPEVPSEIRVVFEDKDSILLVCDQLKFPVKNKESSEHFIKLGEYWRNVVNFPRSLLRIKRAMELTPGNAPAHIEAAKTLAYWAVNPTEPVNPQVRSERLNEAFKEVEEAIKLKGKVAKALHMLAWIYDEVGEFNKAIELYKEAQVQDRKEALGENREETHHIGYNLACSLTKDDRLAEACKVLGEVVEKDKIFRDHAKVDPDFKKLRESQEWKDIFEEIVKG